MFPLEQAMDEPGQLSGQFLGTCGEADKKDAKKIHGRKQWRFFLGEKTANSQVYGHLLSFSALQLGKNKFGRREEVESWVFIFWVVATQIFWRFHPENWGFMIHFDEHIFQMGWFNHQSVNLMTPPLVKGSVLHHGIPTFFSVSVHPGWKVCFGDAIVSNDMGTIISQSKDPYKPISIMECHSRLFWSISNFPQLIWIYPETGKQFLCLSHFLPDWRWDSQESTAGLDDTSRNPGTIPRHTTGINWESVPRHEFLVWLNLLVCISKMQQVTPSDSAEFHEFPFFKSKRIKSH